MRAAAPVPRLSARVLSLSSTTPTYILPGLPLSRNRVPSPEPSQFPFPSTLPLHPSSTPRAHIASFKMVEQTEAFKKAVVDSKKLTSKPDNDELLSMYGKSEARALAV